MYHKGRRFEYKVRDFLKERAWVVYRSYASKGEIDLYAVKNGVKLGIQVKHRKTGSYLSPEELERLSVFRQFMQSEKAIHHMNYWSDGKIKTAAINGPMHIILAHSLPNSTRIYWNILSATDTWNDASKLIKTGKL